MGLYVQVISFEALNGAATGKDGIEALNSIRFWRCMHLKGLGFRV
jgi:hypothetical protein